jgi:signal transduction histidine kinase
MNWRRFDTLFLRLFVLMWVALVLSSMVAFSVVVPTLHGHRGGANEHVPGRPELPPQGMQMPPQDHGTVELRSGADRRPPASGDHRGPGGLPPQALWLDYSIRVVIIAFFAAVGARWLSRPTTRLVAAASQLARNLREGRPVPSLDVHEGTSEVRNASLVFNEMARRLQEQFDIRGLHLAAVSHDLRTPLTRMRLRLERMPDPDARLCIKDLVEMNELIDSSLAVLREQREAAPPSLVDIKSLLLAVADDQAALGYDVAVLDDADGGDLYGRAHPAGLRRVLVNIVGNAVRYGRRARLSAQRDALAVVVRVDDDGPGIPAEQMQQVLQPWVRLQSGSTAISGYGLGLAIARDLVERDGGKLALSNRPAGGLRVELTLEGQWPRSHTSSPH